MDHEFMMQTRRVDIPLDGVTAADLETLLGMIGIDCLADTIAQYWSIAERRAVFSWASAKIAVRRCPGLLVPPVPAVLQPFIAASAAA